jgi:hypothetical protein
MTMTSTPPRRSWFAVWRWGRSVLAVIMAVSLVMDLLVWKQVVEFKQQRDLIAKLRGKIEPVRMRPSEEYMRAKYQEKF